MTQTENQSLTGEAPFQEESTRGEGLDNTYCHPTALSARRTQVGIENVESSHTLKKRLFFSHGYKKPPELVLNSFNQ